MRCKSALKTERTSLLRAEGAANRRWAGRVV